MKRPGPITTIIDIIRRNSSTDKDTYSVFIIEQDGKRRIQTSLGISLDQLNSRKVNFFHKRLLMLNTTGKALFLYTHGLMEALEEVAWIKTLYFKDDELDPSGRYLYGNERLVGISKQLFVHFDKELNKQTTLVHRFHRFDIYQTEFIASHTDGFFTDEIAFTIVGKTPQERIQLMLFFRWQGGPQLIRKRVFLGEEMDAELGALCLADFFENYIAVKYPTQARIAKNLHVSNEREQENKCH